MMCLWGLGDYNWSCCYFRLFRFGCLVVWTSRFDAGAYCCSVGGCGFACVCAVSWWSMVWVLIVVG